MEALFYNNLRVGKFFPQAEKTVEKNEKNRKGKNRGGKNGKNWKKLLILLITGNANTLGKYGRSETKIDLT